MQNINPQELNEEQLNEEQLNELLIENTDRLKSLLQFNVVNNEEEFQLVNQEYDPNNRYLNLNNILSGSNLAITNNDYIISENRAINENDIPANVEFVISNSANDYSICNKNKNFYITFSPDRFSEIYLTGILDNTIENNPTLIEEKRLYLTQLQKLNNQLAIIREGLIQEEVIQQGIASQIQNHNNPQPVNEYENENNALIQKMLREDGIELDPNHDFQDEINEDEDEINEDEDEIEMENQRLLIQNSPEYELKFEEFKQQCTNLKNECRANNIQYPARYFNDFKDFAIREYYGYQFFEFSAEIIDTMPDSFMYFWKTINQDILENGNLVFGFNHNDKFHLFNHGMHCNDYIYFGGGFDTSDLIYLLRKDLIKYLEITLEIDLGDLDYNRNISEQCIEKVMIRLLEGQNLDDLQGQELLDLFNNVEERLRTIAPDIKTDYYFQKIAIDKCLVSANFENLTIDEIFAIVESIRAIIPKIGSNKYFKEIYNECIIDKFLGNVDFENLTIDEIIAIVEPIRVVIPDLENNKYFKEKMEQIIQDKFITIINSEENINDKIDNLLKLKITFPEAFDAVMLCNQNLIMQDREIQAQFAQNNFNILAQLKNLYDTEADLFQNCFSNEQLNIKMSNLDFSFMEALKNVVSDKRTLQFIFLIFLQQNPTLNLIQVETIIENLKQVIDKEVWIEMEGTKYSALSMILSNFVKSEKVQEQLGRLEFDFIDELNQMLPNVKNNNAFKCMIMVSESLKQQLSTATFDSVKNLIKEQPYIFTFDNIKLIMNNPQNKQESSERKFEFIKELNTSFPYITQGEDFQEVCLNLIITDKKDNLTNLDNLNKLLKLLPDLIKNDKFKNIYYELAVKENLIDENKLNFVQFQNKTNNCIKQVKSKIALKNTELKMHKFEFNKAMNDFEYVDNNRVIKEFEDLYESKNKSKYDID